MKKKVIILVFAFLVCLWAAGCGKSKETFQVGLVTDTDHVEKDSFEISAWEGADTFVKAHEDTSMVYLGSATKEEFLPNLDRLSDQGCRLVWGVGFQMGESVMEAAVKHASDLNPGTNYAAIDYAWPEDKCLPNLTGVVFDSQDGAFLAGYIASFATQSECVGFLGGVRGEALDRFEYGFRYGVLYGAREQKKDIDVQVEYADTFSEKAAGKELALDMYQNGCDLIFHAAGETGLGVMEAATLTDHWVIGVDEDQYDLAPANVLTSVLKRVDLAIVKLTTECWQGKEIGGRNYTYGLKDGCVGIPRENPNLTEKFPGLYEKTMKLQRKVEDKELTVPLDKETFIRASGEEGESAQ